jgi:S-DNA-T family DNA segregation ATPase FtsK/SpoIIIE
MARRPEEVAREIAGYLLLLAATLSLLAVLTYHPLDPSLFSAGSDTVHNLLSRGGAAIAGGLVTLFGVLALGVPVLLALVGWTWLRGGTVETPYVQSAAWSAALAAGDGLLATLIGQTPYRGGVLAWGGELGRLVGGGLTASLGTVGALLLCGAGLVAGIVLGVRWSLAEAFGGAGGWFKRQRSEMAAGRARRRQERHRDHLRQALVRRHEKEFPPEPPPPLVLRERVGDGRFRLRRVAQVEAVAEAHEEETAEAATAAQGAEPRAVRRRPARRVEAVPVQEVFEFVRDTPAAPLPERTMLLPPPFTPPDPAQLAAMRELVEIKCKEFKVEGRVEDVLPGPVITTFEFRPAAGVKYAQVVALEEDLALGLQVEAVRVERIPGKATVGIEVPNPERQTIVLREIVDSPKFIHSASPLTLALGRHPGGRSSSTCFCAPVDRQVHRLRQERQPQRHDLADPVQGDARCDSS